MTQAVESILPHLAPSTLASLINDLEDALVHHPEMEPGLREVIQKAKAHGRERMTGFEAWLELTGPHTAYTPSYRVIADGDAAMANQAWFQETFLSAVRNDSDLSPETKRKWGA